MQQIRYGRLAHICFVVFILQSAVFAQLPDEPPRSRSPLTRFFSIYRGQPSPPLVLENSPRLDSLIRDGRLELTLADALALALENNLDIAIQRYIPQYARTDLLRTRSGQAPRGFQGASIPGGLTSGALGSGVSASGTGTGIGSAGGITGGGGSVSVGPSGSFDPAFSMNFSWDRVTSPLNTVVVSGVPIVTGQTTAISTNYAQMFHAGTSYFLALSGQRQTSTQQYLQFNPAYVTRFSFGVHQPLLSGFGYLPNERFIRVAGNNAKVSEEVFRQQIIDTVVLVANTYWDLAALQENVRLAEQSLTVSEQLFKDNQFRLEVGTMSQLDVLAAESEVASRTRDLTVARTSLQLQEAALKNLISRRVTADLDAAGVVLRDSMPEPRDADVPDFRTAFAGAMESRPDLRQTERGLENQDIAIRFTENSLLPEVGIFGFLAGAGLQGRGAANESGVGGALSNSFTADYPEYAGGASLTLPIRNRQAQADNLRAQLEGKQMQVNLQRTRNRVAVEIRKAIIGMMQGKAQVEAAHQAVRLAREIYEGERARLQAGASTSYQVILRERDWVAARQAEVSAMVTYAKAIVEMDRARGAVLERNGIELDDALSGSVSKTLVTPFSANSSKQESR